MKITRRRFVQLGSLVAAHGVTSPFWMRLGSAKAFSPGVPGAPTGRKLIVLLLNGGNDGFNMVVPYGLAGATAGYYGRRPTIGIKAADVLKLENGLGLHPSLAKVRDLYTTKRQVAVINGVGYDTPDLSHFSSMDIMQTGSPIDRTSRTGWLGRWMDQTENGATIRAVAIGNYMPQLLAGTRESGVAVPSFGGFAFSDGADTTPAGPLTDSEPYRLHEAFLACADVSSDDVVATALQEAERRTVTAVRAVNSLGDTAAPPPATLADQISMAMTLLRSRLGVDIAFVHLPGFDTHANEVSGQAGLLASVDEAIGRFATEAAASPSPDDFLLMTFSEFGRRLAENGTTGTDHGTANPMLVVGGGVKGGLYGAYPDLGASALDPNGNVRRTVEIREVYATILDRWLGGPSSQEILGYTAASGLHPLDFVRQ
jgi:uncharacterized protein (DUF1501 family)